MQAQSRNQLLLKILIGAAWIDGVITREERRYLHDTAIAHHLAEDPEIKLLLSEIKPVSAAQCHGWLEEYLGHPHSQSDYQKLLESISALIYSDGDVDTREAELLNRLQRVQDAAPNSQNIFDRLLGMIRKVYQEAVADQG
ncbi:MAG: TerB family tellurite resistance protein [Cyanobacteria bacterium P01_H01_bin.15]